MPCYHFVIIIMATETIGMLSADSTSSNGIKLCELLYNGYWEFDNGSLHVFVNYSIEMF